MNILFLTPRDSKTSLGGVERHVWLVTEELVRRGHRVKELSLDETDKSYKDYKNYKDNKHDNFFKDSPWHTPGRILSLRPVLFKLRAWGYLWQRRELFGWAEVVHVHDVFWWIVPMLLIMWINKYYKSYNNYKNRGRLFVTFHGWEGRWPPSWSAVWQKKLAAWLSNGTMGVGNFYQKWYGVKPDRVVWGVLDPKIAKYAKLGENRERGPYKGPTLPRQGRTFAFFGRLEKVNGIEIMLDAMRYIKVRPWRTSRSDLFRCIFVGDGNYREEAEKVGKVTGMLEEPWRYLADVDIVIASSYLAILEASGMRKRIIAVANNPLKRDYLEGHPMRKWFEVAGSSDELIGLITDKNYKDYKDYKEDREKSRNWALRQTVGKLTDEYLKLWQL